MNYSEFFKTHSNSNLTTMPNERLRQVVRFKTQLVEFFKPTKDFHILPCDYPLEGMVGFTAFRQETADTEMSILLELKVAGKATQKEYETKEEFEKAFSEAWDSKFSIECCDDPVKRLSGFITENREERVWHFIAFSKLGPKPLEV
jgi:hypothetical protein